MQGLPEILIEFLSKAVSFINRSSKGIVAVILKDGTENLVENVYSDLSKVKITEWTESNYDLISKCFMGSPIKVIVIRLAENAADYSAGLTILENRRFDYLAVPFANSTDTAAISSWIKAQRLLRKDFKAVLANEAGDNEGIINLTTEDIKVGEKIYSTGAYTTRIAGILAGLSLSMSATYYVLTEVDDVKAVADPDAKIKAGELILINDGEKVKIGRAVNSLVTIAEPKNPSWKKIKIIEGQDMMNRDISKTYADKYIGKVPNTYDNKMLFFSAVGTYYTGLEKLNVLDPDFNNYMDIDVEAHAELITLAGLNPTEMKVKEIREYNTASTVYSAGQVKFLDAMEDSKMRISM